MSELIFGNSTRQCGDAKWYDVGRKAREKPEETFDEMEVEKEDEKVRMRMSHVSEIFLFLIDVAHYLRYWMPQ